MQLFIYTIKRKVLIKNTVQNQSQFIFQVNFQCNGVFKPKQYQCEQQNSSYYDECEIWNVNKD